MVLAYTNGQVKGVILGLLVVALCAIAVYAICRFLAGRPDWGAVGACVVAIVGVLLVLLDNL